MGPKVGRVHPQWRIPEPLHIQIKLAATAAVAALPLLLLASLLVGLEMNGVARWT